MQQTIDTIYPFKGYGDYEAKCRLRIFEEEGKPTVVIATELSDNEGTSITNAAECVATQVYQWLERPAQGITLIEHYEKDGEESYAQERFAVVTFREIADGKYIGPDWRHITKEEIERMIGQPL